MTSSQEPSDGWPRPIVLSLDDLSRTHQELVSAARAQFLRSLPDPQEARVAFVRSLNLQTLMRNGWFPDLSLSFLEIRQVAEAFNDSPERAQAASEFLCASLRDQLHDIEAKLISAFPNRAEILRDAFQAHRERKWNLSVTVFLTQVDGLFYDRFLKSLFTRADQDELAERIEEVSDELDGAMLRRLLYDDWPLAMSRSERAKQPGDFTQLNRHRVLHGEVTDFGTEENSLKAISLLNYCALVLPKPEQGPSEANGSE